MVYVTHDQVEAMTMADRIAVMKDGEVQQWTRPLAMYHVPRHQFVASFIGSPAMNLVKGRVTAPGRVEIADAVRSTTTRRLSKRRRAAR